MTISPPTGAPLSVSRYLGIPLLAAISLAISLALLPMEPAGANGAQAETGVTAVADAS